MNLRHFRYFVAVAEELSFTKAARRLHISQPPLSQHIQDMERDLGVRLFERSRGHVELTEAGALFLEEARKTLDQAEHALDVARRAGRGELVTLRIGYGAWAPFTGIFPQLISTYRARCPSVQLTLRSCGTEETLQQVLGGELDIGIIRPVSGFNLKQDLIYLPVFSEKLMLALPCEHQLARMSGAIKLALLSREPFILGTSEQGQGSYRQVYDACRKEGFSPHTVQQAKDAETILSLVGSGLGITILPASLRSIGISNVVWKPLSTSADVVTTVYAIHHASRYASTHREAFIAMLQETDAAAAGDAA